MRLRFTLSLLLAVACSATTARAQYLNAVYSKDSRDVIAVGEAGAVYRSLDGGATWMKSNVGARSLRDVAARGLTVVAVGDSGKIWRSTDSGGSWGLQVVAGAPDLAALAWPSPDTVFAVGAGGLVLRSIDAGASWSPQTSGTVQRLNAVRFRDALSGWAVGDQGTAISTANGGASWSPSATPTTQRLLGVDFLGGLVWAVGEKGVALRSASGGAAWTPQNLRLDAGSDVRVVWIQSPDTLLLAGGGGFVRRSLDGGATWSYPIHQMQSRLGDLYVARGACWIVSSATPLIERSTNLGATWASPAGATRTGTWPRILPAAATIRGSTLTLNPLDHKTIYAMLGATLWRTRDDGANWSPVGTVPGGGTSKTNAFVISPKDTNLMLAAVGTPDRVVRSTDGGVNWITTFTQDFGEYGVPLEMHPDRPDTVYFGPDGDSLVVSHDFGATWKTLSKFSFQSPCDIAVVPESDSGVIVVGDGITSSGIGKIHRSNDGGVSWSTVYAPGSGGSEIPQVVTSRLGNTHVYASGWSNGVLKRSLDAGLTWSTALNVSQSWGLDVAKDDPNLVWSGRYSNNFGYVSVDGGANWTGWSALGGSNYTVFVRDRGFVLAEQSDGIYRFALTDTFPLQTTQSLTVAAPNGGETWGAGEVRDVTWNPANVVLAKIEYRRTAADPWQLVALADGAAGRWAWTVPGDSTADAAIRVSDAWDGAPSDVSDGPFAIQVARLVTAESGYDFGSVLIGSSAGHAVAVSNPGNGSLTVSLVSSSNAAFWTGRSAFTIPPGGADTLGVFYAPDAVQSDTATITIASNDPDAPDLLTLVGRGVNPLAVGDGAPLAFALLPGQPNPFRSETMLRYALPTRARVRLEVFDLQGHRVSTLVDREQEAGRFAVPFGAADPKSGSRLAAGVYFVRLEAGRQRATRKIVMMP